MSEDLSPTELAELCGARTLHRQVIALVRMGLPFRFAGRTVHVKRVVAEEWPQWQQKARNGEPRLDMVR